MNALNSHKKTNSLYSKIAAVMTAVHTVLKTSGLRSLQEIFCKTTHIKSNYFSPKNCHLTYLACKKWLATCFRLVKGLVELEVVTVGQIICEEDSSLHVLMQPSVLLQTGQSTLRPLLTIKN